MSTRIHMHAHTRACTHTHTHTHTLDTLLYYYYVYTGFNPLLGDALCMVGALCYAITNVSAEFVAKNFSFTQFLGYLGFGSCFISAIQL